MTLDVSCCGLLVYDVVWEVVTGVSKWCVSTLKTERVLSYETSVTMCIADHTKS